VEHFSRGAGVLRQVDHTATRCVLAGGGHFMAVSDTTHAVPSLPPATDPNTPLTTRFLAGSPTDFIMLQDGEQWTFATVAEAIDEKTPLKALV
jgi:hypothetical protein